MKRKILFSFFMVATLFMYSNAQEEDHRLVPQDVKEQLREDSTIQLYKSKFQSALNVNCEENPNDISLIGGKQKDNLTTYQYAYPFTCNSLDKEYKRKYNYIVYVSHLVYQDHSESYFIEGHSAKEVQL